MEPRNVMAAAMRRLELCDDLIEFMGAVSTMRAPLGQSARISALTSDPA